MKSDCANEHRIYWQILYVFVLVLLLGSNIMACLLKEGVFDADEEEPFMDAIAVMSSTVFLSDGMISDHMEKSMKGAAQSLAQAGTGFSDQYT